MRINHNIPSLRALHQLEKSNGRLDKTLERLSSGLRINHAADDAAGLAITQKMDTQVRGLKQANRNAMDGISLIQTAEGALNEVHSMLQRIRELAVQVSNGTYDAADRKAVQDEVTQLQNEVQRISDDIEFNEMKLLNGDLDRRAFSTNADIADIVSMSDTVDAGNYTFDVSQIATKTADTGGAVTLFDANGEATVSGTLNINGEQVEITAGTSSEAVFAQIRDLSSRVNVNVTTDATPFGNGRTLTLEVDQYGPNSLDVTGDLMLLQGLGLDSAQFNPNSDSVYIPSTQPAVLPANIVNAGTVTINGINVTFASGETPTATLGLLRAANIPNVQFGLDGSNLYIYSSEQISVTAQTSPADDALAAELAGLATATEEVATAARSVLPGLVDTAATPGAAGINIVVGSSSVTAVAFGGASDFTTEAGIDAAVATMNAALTADGNTDTRIVYDEALGKIVAYDGSGEQIQIVPTNLALAGDVTLAEALGYDLATDTTLETKFGNLGRNIQINTATLVYDDPATPNLVDGFPVGTTVSTDGQDIVFESNNNFELRLVGGTSTGTVTMNLLETGPLDLQIGANEGQFMEVRIQNLSPRALGITDINLSTSEGAQAAITTVDDAIQTISSVRSKLGAYQNRLEYTIANLGAASENMTASLSRILDADMAYEMSQFTQQNIIQQAGTSMLAQANQRPQSLLQLLQG